MSCSHFAKEKKKKEAKKKKERKKHCEDLMPCGQRFGDQIQQRLNILGWAPSAKSNTAHHPKKHPTNCEAWWRQHYVVGLFLLSKDWALSRDWRDNATAKCTQIPPQALCNTAVDGQVFQFYYYNDPHKNTQSDSKIGWWMSLSSQSQLWPKPDGKSVDGKLLFTRLKWSREILLGRVTLQPLW